MSLDVEKNHKESNAHPYEDETNNRILPLGFTVGAGTG